ncbi:MAG: YggT family protein [Firmicutes bacterium]|nr:YggT family protein [Bacillota bacterium]
MAGIVFNVISLVLQIYWYILLARLLLSFFPDVSRTAIGRVLFAATEFYLGAFRRVIPQIRLGGGYLDISYIVAFIAYWFIENGVLTIVSLLFSGIR